MQKKFAQLIGVFALLVLVGAGCANTQAPVEGDSMAMEKAEPVVIGFMSPLSGDAASYGLSVQRAAELALANAGVENITLVSQDSRCDAKDAVNAATALITVEGASAILGELCSGATLAAAPIAEENKVVLISPASTAPTVSEAGEYVYRTIPSDALQGSFGAELVAEDGYSRLAVLAINDDYGVGFTEVLEARFPELGGEIVAAETFTAGDVDLRTQLTKINAAEPEALYIISNSPDAAIAALKQVVELGLDVAVYGSEGLKGEEITDGAGEAAEGLVVSTVSAGTEEFVTAHTEAYDEAPGPFAAQAYDAMNALIDAVESGATTGEEIKAFLDTYSTTGVSGDIAFDENGDVGGVYGVYQVVEGVFVAR